MKRYSDSTLMRMTKAELIEMLRVAEHNQDVLEDAIAQIDKNIKYWAPVRHGFWEQGDMYDYGDVCSLCQYDSAMEPCKWSYCPSCGAKMDRGTGT